MNWMHTDRERYNLSSITSATASCYHCGQSTCFCLSLSACTFTASSREKIQSSVFVSFQVLRTVFLYFSNESADIQFRVGEACIEQDPCGQSLFQVVHSPGPDNRLGLLAWIGPLKIASSNPSSSPLLRLRISWTTVAANSPIAARRSRSTPSLSNAAPLYALLPCTSKVVLLLQVKMRNINRRGTPLQTFPQ